LGPKEGTDEAEPHQHPKPDLGEGFHTLTSFAPSGADFLPFKEKPRIATRFLV
jgi:hypothetical protein